MENKLTNVIAGETRIWERPEKSGIYLLSEFIDNSKSSYEEMINNGQSHEMPIEVTFDKQHGYLSIADKGLGFEIMQAIGTIGNDEIRYGQTNQYFVGMKAAMNFFGDFSILVSEQVIDGINRRFANFFIYRHGYWKEDIELETTNQTGSEIFLFVNYQAAKHFWRETLKFKNVEDSFKFPGEEELDKSEFSRYSKTEFLLDNIDDNYPYLTASLFQRYSPLVNIYPNIKIYFRCLDSNGYSRLLNNENKIKPLDKGHVYPEYFKVIQKNNLNQEVALSFDKLNDNDNLKLFNQYLNENNQEFKKNLESLLYNDINQHFTKLKRFENDRGKSSSNELGDFLDESNFVWDNYPESAKNFQFTDKEKNWDRWPFAKDLVKIFLSNLYDRKNNLADIKFKIKNLTIYDEQVVVVARDSLDKKFNLDFNLNIYSINFNKKGGIYGTTPMKWMTGLTLIQNNRAVYHGPNVDRTNISSRQLDVLTPFPERILTNEFERRDPNAFPNFYTNKSDPTGIVIGGNTEGWPSRIFGDVKIPDSSLFSSGTNKVLISNITPLQNFIMDILKDSGINVLARWVYLLDNDGFKGNELPKDVDLKTTSQKTFEKEYNLGKTLVEIVKNMHMQKEKVNEVEPSSNYLNLEPIGGTDVIGDSIDPFLLEGDEQIEESTLVGLDDETRVIKKYEQLFRGIKNNSWLPLKISNVNLDNNNNLKIDLNDKAFGRWNRQLEIKFDSSQVANDINLILENNQPIGLIIPLNPKSWDLEDLFKQTEKITRNITAVLVQASGYHSISTNKKFLKKRDDKQTTRALETFLKVKLGKISLKNNEQD